MRPSVLHWVTAFAVVSVPGVAHADRSGREALEIVNRDGRSWDAILREVETEPATSGRAYEFGVRSRGASVRCQDYELSPDAAAGRAFEIEGCDEVTQMTRLRVVDRSALFAPGDVVPVPLAATLRAALRQSATVHGGGAPPEAGAKVWCSVALQPYLRDGLRGVTVPLSPDRFELRPLEERIHSAPDGSGWIARGESSMEVRFRYEVIDRVNGAKVLEDVATLSCRDAPTDRPTELDLGTSFVVVPPRVPPRAAIEAAPRRPASLLAPAMVSLGIGGVGLVATTIFGPRALAEKAMLDGQCPSPGTCPATAQANITALRIDSTVADVSLGVTLVGASVGVILLLLNPRPHASNVGSSGTVRVDPWMSLARSGLSGTF